jgi:hypothetical protein
MQINFPTSEYTAWIGFYSIRKRTAERLGCPYCLHASLKAIKLKI